MNETGTHRRRARTVPAGRTGGLPAKNSTPERRRYWLAIVLPTLALVPIIAAAPTRTSIVIPTTAFVVFVFGTATTHWWLTRPIATLEGQDFARLPETKVWFVVAATTAGLSLGAGVMVAESWADLMIGADWQERLASVLLPIAALAVFSYGPRLLAGPLDSPLPNHGSRVALVFLLTGLGLLVVGSGMILVGTAAADAGAGSIAAAEDSIDTLVDHRRTLILFLGVAAFVVVATVVATAALRRALLAHDSREDYPASTLLLYGAFLSLLISLLFVPAYLALQEAGGRIVDTLAPVTDADFPGRGWFERQSDLRDLLGLDVSVAGVFTAAFAVLTPVASSVLAAYLQDAPDKRTGRNAYPNLGRLPSAASLRQNSPPRIRSAATQRRLGAEAAERGGPVDAGSARSPSAPSPPSGRRPGP